MPESEAVQWSVAAVREAQSRYNNNTVASEGQHRLAAEVASMYRDI